MKPKFSVFALSLAIVAGLASGCAKQADKPKDSPEKEATGPAPGSSGVGAVNKARSVANEANSQTYKGDEGSK